MAQLPLGATKVQLQFGDTIGPILDSWTSLWSLTRRPSKTQVKVNSAINPPVSGPYTFFTSNLGLSWGEK